ncbi:MAG: Type 1 glutamine amidotransferase-like domain-containing protein [Candidatus Pacebacteria bacterium]|nr:Type 1 glutamine amidotransferase-like domain-containing protein [Candidatus Paceibacterota bacterium]
MKLFLASSFDKTAPLLEKKLQEPIKGKKVIFIANPADCYEGDRWWIKLDRDAFIKLGCEIIEIDLRNILKEEFIKKLEKSDIIHFCGGSVLYSISLIKEKGFDKLIKEFVKKNKVIYTGTSAGSMIVAKDLSLSVFDSDEKQFVDKIKDYSGLGLVNFLIMPHSNNNDFSEGNIKAVSFLPKYSQPVIFLYDNQAIWVVDDKIEIIE